MKEKSTIRIELERLLPRMLLLNLPVFCVSLIWGFSLKMLLGLLAGTLLAGASLVYLGMTIDRCVDTTEKKAKRAMLSCYLVRYVALAGLCYVGVTFNVFSFVGMILPQFYVRIILTLETFLDGKFNKSPKK